MHRILLIQRVQWFGGIFTALMGWLMLVTPHQFVFFQTRFPWLIIPLGILLFSSGILMVSLPAFNLRLRWYIPVHFLVFMGMMITGIALAISNAWVNPVNFYLLGTAILISSLGIFQSNRSNAKPFDLMMFSIGISQAITGLFILILWRQLNIDIFNVSKIESLFIASSFVFGGGLLAAVHLFPPRKNTLFWFIHLFNSASFLVFFIRTTLPEHAWVSAAYYVTFALIIGFYPKASHWIDNYHPYKLQNRLSIWIALLTILVLTLTIVLTNVVVTYIDLRWTGGDVYEGRDLALGLLLILLFATVFMAIRFSRSLTAPLHDLARASQGFAEGDEEIAVEGSQIEEISLLTATFNDMRTRLSARNQELELSRQLLEQRVEQRTQELAIRAAELEALMDSVPAAVIISHDPDSTLVTANLAAYELLQLKTGFDLTQISNMTAQKKLVFMRNGNELSLDDFPLFVSARDGSSHEDYEMDVLLPDSSRISVLGNITPLFDLQGRPAGAIAAFTDITKLKKLEADLQNSNTDLQDFAYIASHDLQEPLRKITAFGAILTNKLSERMYPDEADALDRMTNAARRMSTMIQDLLAYSRVSTRGQPFRSVDLNHLVDEVIMDLEVQIVRTGGRIEYENLPEIYSDELQIHQLLLNLLSNGLKYHRQGVPPILKIRCKIIPGPSSGASTARIEVEDNGIGFDIKYLNRIFQPFQRLHGRSQYEGTGIGLAICKKIVDRHNGTITARSTLNEGSTFIIELPLEHKPVEVESPVRDDTSFG